MLAERIVAPAASSAGRARVDDLLRAIAGSPAGTALSALLEVQPGARDLTAAIADGSPYLFDLIRAVPARWVALLEADPQARLDTLLVDIAAAASHDQATAMRLWRRAKAEASLLIAAADTGGVWNLATIMQALTQVADAAVGAAVRYLLAEAAREGKLIVSDPAQPERGSGYAVLALGKMGAHELELFERYRPHRLVRP